MKKMNSLFCALICTLLFVNSTLAQKSKSPVTEAAIRSAVNEAYEKYKSAPGGANASYIPFLADVDPKLYGIAVCTADGKVYEVGDTKYEFGIESISKVFVLALAMEDRGPEAIQDSIGVNATGMPFNSVLAVELEPARAVNPLVNAGAMATNSFVKAPNSAAKWTRIDDIFAKFAGRRLPVIDKLYASETATNQHNRAIAWLLYSYGRFYDNVDESVDLYTKACSYGTNTRDLAVMAGTLANNGINPVTKERVIKADHCPKILATMITEGLYDSTGDWVYHTGVPGKSGVGGGIIAVIPGKLAIAVFAPPLDKAGNSVKGQLAAKYIVDKLGLNLLDGR
ncbi:L-glutaminase [Chitinophaga dinghuensis]|uniref:Glutaminase n=1 Tax=Chitinophaga dinghuensis TaxID=1539050 RepID=A0A327VJZ8_9BACT|nr:glutaminase A [Chitinophaga dinghuensis]RAJ75030.1 L-glutaminase [Chitinophaga dinghuensis]